MAQTTVIQGPALIVRGSLIVYTEGDVTITYKREIWNPKGAISGSLGARLKSTAITVSAKPQGMISAAIMGYMWPFTGASIGASILASTALVVTPLTGNKYTFARSGISKLPALSCAPTKTAFKDNIEFLCLGDPSTTPTNAAYFQTLAATAADTSFDETKVISPNYVLSWGTTPFDVIDTEDGVDFEPQMSIKPMYSATYGQIDAILEDLGLVARFIPVGITEANLFTMMKLQDTGALIPGASIGGATDLIATGTGLTVTAKNMGAADGAARFGVGVFRQGEVVMHNLRKWSVGAPSALWAFA